MKWTWNEHEAQKFFSKLFFFSLFLFYFHLKERCESYLPVQALAVYCHEAAWQTAWHMPRVKYQTLYTTFICIVYKMYVYWETLGETDGDTVKVCSVCDTRERYTTTKCVAHPTPKNSFHSIMMVGAYLGKRARWFVCMLACQPACLLVCLFVGLHTLHLTITSTLLSMSSRLENHFRWTVLLAIQR